MKIVSIAIKDLRITLKDKKAMAQILLFPLVLIFVLGLALSSLFSTANDTPTIKTFEIALVDQDGGTGATALKDFLAIEEVAKVMTYEEMTEVDASAAVKKGDLPAYILLPKGYSDAVAAGEQTTLRLVEDPGSTMKGQIVESILKSYTDSTSAVSGVVASTNTSFEQYKLDGHMVLPEVMKVMDSETPLTVAKKLAPGEKILEAIQYYAAGMLVMFIMFVGMLGTNAIIEEREQKTLMRLMGTTVTKKEILTGKLLGLMILGALDVFILIMFTNVFFKVDWGTDIVGLVVLSLAMIFAAAGLAMFLASVFKSSKAVDSVNPVLIMILSFIGGSMYPIYAMPESMQTMSKFTLNNWALRGYMDLMLGKGLEAITMSLVVLVGMGAVFLVAGISRLRLN